MLGLTHTLGALISASLPGESLWGQVSCQAGQGSLGSSRSLLPAPQVAARPGAPGTGSLQAGELGNGGGEI